MMARKPRQTKQRRRSQGNKRDYDGQNNIRQRVAGDQSAVAQAKRWGAMYLS